MIFITFRATSSGRLTVTAITSTDIYFTCGRGMLDAKLKNPGDVLDHTRGGPGAFVAKLEHFRTR